MKRFFVLMVVLIVLALFGVTIYFLWDKSQVEPVVFETREPFRADIVSKTVATGSVVPRREITIKPQVSGIVESLYVEPGQRLKKGDLVAKVTIVPNMVNLSAAENRVKRAKISLDNAENEYARNKRLYEDGLLAEQQFVRYDLDLKNARQEVSAAEDNLVLIREGARKQAGTPTNTIVRATRSGMVLEVPVEVGDSVIEANTFNAGTTIASVADMDEMIFEGKVDESEVGKIHEGMDLLLAIGAIEDKQFNAKLEYIAPKGVEEDGAIQFEIRAALERQADVFIRANYSANADIVLDRRDDVLAIREAWLQFDGPTPFVEIETGEQEFERREIEVGLSDGVQIEIVSGVTEADRIKDTNSAS